MNSTKDNANMVNALRALLLFALVFIPFAFTHAQATPTVSILANGVTNLTIPQGGSYVLSWNSSNVSPPCTISYVRTDGQPNGSFDVTPNVAGSGGSGLLGSYTITCQSVSGPVSKTVTITLAPPTPSVTLLAGGKDILVINAGENYTLSWDSKNVTGPTCTMSYSPGPQDNTFPVDANVPGSGNTGHIGSYTLLCQSASGPLSKTVNITATQQPSVAIIAPATTTTMAAGSNLPISWTSQNAPPGSAVFLRLLLNGAVVADIGGAENISGSYAWAIPATFPAGVYEIKAMLVSSQNVTLASITGPSLTISAPQTGYNINSSVIFPSKNSLIPAGTSYGDTIPYTLDLALMGQRFMGGALASHVMYPFNKRAPGGPATFSLAAARFLRPNPSDRQTYFDMYCGAGSSPPCIANEQGQQNWGKFALGMIQSRAMTGYGVTDASDTLTGQYQSIKDMLDYFSSKSVEYGITPNTIEMEALMARYEQDPANTTLKNAINEFVRMHKDEMCPGGPHCTTPLPNGGSFSYVFHLPNEHLQSFDDYMGTWWLDMFINGRASLAMWHWYNLTGNSDAYNLGVKLNTFMRDYAPLWEIPAGFPDRTMPGAYAGHVHSYLQAALAFAEEAEARFKSNPSDPIAVRNVTLARDMLEFTKVRTRGGIIGNFGEIGTAGDMIRLANKLDDLSAYVPQLSINYYDQVEIWTRNTLVETQIDAASASAYIGNAPGGDERTDHVADKSVGLFFSDATHALSIPEVTQYYNPDGPSNAVRAVYDVWAHAVQFKGNVAYVNFLLNRTTPYFDVKSDLPYRGRIEIDMKNSLGAINTIAIRTPGWMTEYAAVKVSRRIGAGATENLPQGNGWVFAGTHVALLNPPPNAIYIVSFPMKAYTMQFQELRDSSQWWYEASYAHTPATGERVQTYTGTFLGYDLVSVDHRPPGGIPRYQRQNLAALISGSAPNLVVNEVAPPPRPTGRFTYQGSPWSPPPPPPPPMHVTLTANGQTTLSITTGQNYLLAWSSTGVQGPTCTISYGAIGGPSGSFPVDANASGSGQSGLIGSYTMTCVKDGQNISKTVTVTSDSPSVAFTSPATAASVAAGANLAIAWTSQNAPANSAVFLRLLLNGAVVADIGSVHAASGSYTWTVHPSIPPGTYAIKAILASSENPSIASAISPALTITQ